MDKTSTKITGKQGEDLAVEYLKNKGYQILERNYVPSWFRVGRKEIDIVAKKNGVFIFVEVKSGQADDEFFPTDRVNFKKQKFLVQAAKSYLLEKKIPQESPWQIDVISVIFGSGGEKPRIEHFENAVGG